MTVELPPVQSLTVAGDHGCALTRTNEVLCWGETRRHHIDDFFGEFTGRPGVVEAAAGASTIALGSTAACAAGAAGITCWWREPPAVLEATYVWRRELAARSISTAGPMLCWIAEDGIAHCEGNFAWNDPGPGAADTPGPRPIAAPGPVSAISVGPANACVVAAEGRVHCWGLNHAGVLGDPSLRHRDEAELVEIPLPAAAVEVAIARLHACARLLDGTVACWGDNRGGAVDGFAGESTIGPTPVAEVDGATRVAVADHRSCALVAGEILCWGRDPHRPARRGDTPGPTKIEDLGEVVDFALGRSHLCAIRGAGEVVCVHDRGEASDMERAAVGDGGRVLGVERRVRPRVKSQGPWLGGEP